MAGVKHFDGLTPGGVTGALVCFADITRFMDIARDGALDRLYRFLREMSEISDRVIEPSSGQIIKYIGDAILIVFPADRADEGVRVLLNLNTRITDWFASQKLANRLSVGIDMGDVVVGRMKPFDTPDVFGPPVNRAATIVGRDQKGRFVISPRAFRALEPSTRRHFHKHTPPVVYLAESA